MINNSMKIRLVEEADQECWDEFILSHPKASPYHLFAWKKAIEAAYGHKCINLCADRNRKIVGVLPLVHIHFPAIINEMVSLPFCDVGSCIAVSDEAQELLLKEAVHFQKKSKVKKLQIRGDLIPTDIVQSNFQARETGKVRMFLELPVSSDELFISFKSKLRSQVRKAGKNGVKFYWGNVEDIDSAYIGYPYFGFGCSSEGEGTYKFKKQWGAKPKPLVWYESIEKRKTKTESSQIGMGKRERVAAMWQKLPLRAANSIGPHLRKYISL